MQIFLDVAYVLLDVNGPNLTHVSYQITLNLRVELSCDIHHICESITYVNLIRFTPIAVWNELNSYIVGLVERKS